MNRLRKKEGFTLVEMMVTIAISAIVILTVSLILVMAYREWRTDNAYVQLRRDAALAVQLMAPDVRESTTNANNILTTTNSITFATNSVRPVVHTFTQNGDKLNSSPFGLIITKGLQRFRPVETNNGVLLHMELENTEFNIAITNETFITVRN